MTIPATASPDAGQVSMTGPVTRWTYAAYALAAALVWAVGAVMWGMPFQLTDHLVMFLRVQSAPLSELVRTALFDPEHLRPLYAVHYKLLSDLSHGHYYLTFQGFHVAMFAALVLLSVAALRVRTVADFAGAAVALVVLLGLHTFTNTLREQTILVVTCCALATTLAFAERPARWRDAAAALNLLIAMFYVETGLLVWVIHTAAYLCGRRGLSRAGLLVLTLLFAMYFGLRFVVLPSGIPPLFPRYTGVGFAILDPNELQLRFGKRPFVLYAYNILASVSSVLFSEPRVGVFQFTRRLLEGELRPWMWLNMLSSMAMTASVVWYLGHLSGWRKWTFSRGHALVLVGFAVLVANAVMSYPYSRDASMSPAGVSYAIAAAPAMAYIVSRLRTQRAIGRAIVLAALMLISAAWCLRTVALTYTLRTTGFVYRNDWVGAEDWLRDQGVLPTDERGLALVRMLRQEAIRVPVPNPGVAQAFADVYLGQGGY